MTVYEYRKKYPKCEYCFHREPGFQFCFAVRKPMKKRTAEKCPCYIPTEWKFDKKRSDTE